MESVWKTTTSKGVVAILLHPRIITSAKDRGCASTDYGIIALCHILKSMLPLTRLISVITMMMVGVLSLTTVTVAQEEELPASLTGIAEYVRTHPDEEIRNGNIITITPDGYRLAQEAYSPHLAGVVASQPALAISYIGRAGAYPVVTSGTALVLVSNQNGEIAAGDYITSSTERGIGMKATQPGYVLGTAQTALTESTVGLIPVSVNIEFVVASDRNTPLSGRSLSEYASDVLTVGLRSVASEPNTALRYAAAALVLIVSIAFGFLVFGRSATNGILAMGRNPLARKSIFVITSFNIILTVAFAAAGLALSLFILAF